MTSSSTGLSFHGRGIYRVGGGKLSGQVLLYAVEETPDPTIVHMETVPADQNEVEQRSVELKNRLEGGEFLP